MTYKWNVRAPFPFDDFPGSKLRPILCLTDPVGENFHVVGAFISTQIPVLPESFDILIDPAEPQWNGTGLKSRSILRLHRLTTFDVSIARKTLGVWPQVERAEVESRLRLLFDL